MQSKESGERQVGQYLFRQDRENLHKALNRVLAGQGDFYDLYIVFATYYHQSTEYREAIAWMEEVAGKLEKYADAKRDAEFLVNYAHVVGNLGSQYAQIKDYYQAKEKHKKAVELYEKAGRRQEMAVGYHQLGRVAQEERDFAEALRDYALALEIFLQYNDKYNIEIAIENLGILFTAWEPPDTAFASLENSDQVKEILKAVLEKSREKNSGGEIFLRLNGISS